MPGREFEEQEVQLRKGTGDSITAHEQRIAAALGKEQEVQLGKLIQTLNF